jgi:hypothetical protein
MIAVDMIPNTAVKLANHTPSIENDRYLGFILVMSIGSTVANALVVVTNLIDKSS